MVKSSRSVSLETSTWLKVEEFAKNNNTDISSAVEELIKKGLEGV